MYTIKIPMEETRYKHICVIPALYEMMHNWVVENDWKAAYSKVDKEGDIETMFYVNEYGKLWNYNIWWRLLKEINSQIRYKMNVDFIGIAVSKVEVVWKGKKYKAYNGEFTFHISGIVEIDYKNQWEKSKIMKPFTNYLLQYLMKKNMEDYRDELWKEMRDLQAFIKSFFGLYQYVNATEIMDPFRGYGFT